MLHSGIVHQEELAVFEPKPPQRFQRAYAIPASFYNVMCIECYLKNSPLFFIVNLKIKQKITFWLSLGHLSIFPIYAVNSFVKKASITHFKFMERRPRDKFLSKQN